MRSIFECAVACTATQHFRMHCFLSVASLYILSSVWTTPPGESYCSRFHFHKHKPGCPIHSPDSFLTKSHSFRAYPCLCLCFGFSQITLMLPFLLMILHFSQIGFTDDLTFMVMPPFTILAACIQA